MEFILARWISFATIMLAVGCCALGAVILPRCGAHTEFRRRLARDVARIGVVSCLILIPASVVRLADQLMALRSSDEPLLSGFRPLLLSTTWGTGFLCQMAALLVALIGFWLAFVRARASTAVGWWLATLGGIALSASLSLQGHAIGNEQSTALAILADATHVLAAGVWLGSVSVIGLVGTTFRNADGAVALDTSGRAESRLQLLVPMITPVALTGAALLVTSGVTATLLQLGEWHELWSTTWGRYVALKVLLMLAIAALGARNWRQFGPRLAQAGVDRRLRRTLGAELGLAALVLLITALLVVTPLPGE